MKIVGIKAFWSELLTKKQTLLLLSFNLKTFETALFSSLNLLKQNPKLKPYQFKKNPQMDLNSKSLIFLHFPTLSLIFLLFFSPSSSSSPSIYDHLRQNSLPVGLLPKGILDFSYDPATGQFQINLTQPCNSKFENQLHYDFNISGFISMGKIGGLSGVTQQELFLWFPVKGIRVDVPSSGLIYFDVGVVDKQFSLSLFENPIECTAADASSVSPGAQGRGDKSRSGKLVFNIRQGDSRASS